MESREQKLAAEALEEMNADRVRDFKAKVRNHIGVIADKQTQLAKLVQEIEAHKKSLRELTLVELDAKVVL